MSWKQDFLVALFWLSLVSCCCIILFWLQNTSFTHLSRNVSSFLKFLMKAAKLSCKTSFWMWKRLTETFWEYLEILYWHRGWTQFSFQCPWTLLETRVPFLKSSHIYTHTHFFLNATSMLSCQMCTFSKVYDWPMHGDCTVVLLDFQVQQMLSCCFISLGSFSCIFCILPFKLPLLLA